MAAYLVVNYTLTNEHAYKTYPRGAADTEGT